MKFTIGLNFALQNKINVTLVPSLASFNETGNLVIVPRESS